MRKSQTKQKKENHPEKIAVSNFAQNLPVSFCAHMHYIHKTVHFMYTAL